MDSGATTSMRTACGNEAQGLPLRTVLLAEGETSFFQLPGGTLLTTKKTAPIVAMSDLMEIGCRVTWCSSEGCAVTHPLKGDLGVRVVNGCPEVDEAVGLELIAEAETTKLRRREAELAVNRLVEGCERQERGFGKMDWELGSKATKDLYSGVGLSWAWLHKAFPGAPSWLVSAIPVVAGTGWRSSPLESSREEEVEEGHCCSCALVLWEGSRDLEVKGRGGSRDHGGPGGGYDGRCHLCCFVGCGPIGQAQGGIWRSTLQDVFGTSQPRSGVR